MCVMLNLPETKRNRQDRSITRAGKRCLPTRMRRVRSLVCPHSGMLAHSNAARGAKHFISRHNQAILSRQRHATWEMSVDWSELQIEQVMPQAWQTNWPKPDNVPADARKANIQGIGNLTLVTKV